jgi:hypothetical protein
VKGAGEITVEKTPGSRGICARLLTADSPQINSVVEESVLVSLQQIYHRLFVGQRGNGLPEEEQGRRRPWRQWEVEQLCRTLY